MKNFFLALQFLTIIPVKIKRLDEKNLPGAVIYFPLIGLFLGLVLAGANNLLMTLNFSDVVVNIILVSLLVVMTGGLHLDGLADTFDGLLSRKNKDETLAIMRDPHVGVMGVLSLITVLSLKVALLSSVGISLKPASLLLMGVVSRWSMVFAMFLFPYARATGKAKNFIDGTGSRIFFSATVIALVCAIAIGRLQGTIIFLIAAASAYVIGRLVSHKIGGMTGDTVGAVNELAEVIILLSICVLEMTCL